MVCVCVCDKGCDISCYIRVTSVCVSILDGITESDDKTKSHGHYSQHLLLELLTKTPVLSE